VDRWITLAGADPISASLRRRAFPEDIVLGTQPCGQAHLLGIQLGVSTVHDGFASSRRQGACEHVHSGCLAGLGDRRTQA
jgi:hypothetical protein